MEENLHIRIDPFSSFLLGMLDRRIIEIMLQDGYYGKIPIPGQLLHPGFADAKIKFEKYGATQATPGEAPIKWAIYAKIIFGQDDYLECDLFRSTRIPPAVAMGMKGKMASSVFDLKPYKNRKIYGVVQGGAGYSFSIKKGHRFAVPLANVGIDVSDDELLARMPEAKPLKIRNLPVGQETPGRDLYEAMPEVTRRLVDVLMGSNKQMNNADIRVGDKILRIYRSQTSGWHVTELSE